MNFGFVYGITKSIPARFYDKEKRVDIDCLIYRVEV